MPSKPQRTEDEKQHARNADAEARKLEDVTRPMNRPEMERYLCAHPPSIPVIASLLHGLRADDARKGGQKTANKRRPEWNTRNKKIRAEYDKMTDIEPRFRAAKLAEREGLHPQQVRKILKTRTR